MSRPDNASVTLKRGPSPSFEGLGDEVVSSRKRFKEDVDIDADDTLSGDKSFSPYETLADDLAQELQCGCCSELCYRPVVVSPCQHFFCGSCCMLWIRNGGTNCPACRGISTSVIPSRPLQSIIDVLLRADPSKARTERERMQADEIYKGGTPMRIPTPREVSPEPNFNQNGEYARPCPHCLPGNPFGWRCPQPIVDPNTDPDHAWHLDDGTPPGHVYCGNCENLLASSAPNTSKCDFCQVSFCGIGVQGRCLAAPLISQHPHNLTDISDLIQSAEVYECFVSNNVEVEIMLDYLTAQRLTPRHIYREIVAHFQSQPDGFKPLFELDLFVDVHSVAAGVDPNPDAPRSKICRLCAAEILLWGIKGWWVRERQKGFLEETVTKRPDCADGETCTRQKDLAHAREFNHIFASPQPDPMPPVPFGEDAFPIPSDPPQSINNLPGDPARASFATTMPLVPSVVDTSSDYRSATSSQNINDMLDRGI
ncbi:hypothetical protein SERLA73DRAFT_56314 [Serpula lacrymans var. lacrymans S7.3]|uniref:RING-type domain-containing protein n=2 Tax=Serpula lacrymans var. lacrymans TaxID=341189 RepID=F8PZN4_SERL3|nr:hypothetical protein SERLA73DRAFT_56314 [Serpula lacrymans var. lacrymans S7.3]